MRTIAMMIVAASLCVGQVGSAMAMSNADVGLDACLAWCGANRTGGQLGECSGNCFLCYKKHPKPVLEPERVEPPKLSGLSIVHIHQNGLVMVPPSHQKLNAGTKLHFAP